jgi:zinc transport system substrate-binding protein
MPARLLVFFLALLPHAARSEAPHVVADIAPVHSLVASVMEGVGVPLLLLDGGADPHDFQLRPSQARALSRAGLVVWMGPELTPWLARVRSGLSEGEGLVLLDVAGTVLRQSRTGDEQDHAHHGADPHAWLDPRNARTWLPVIATWLSRIDPENAAIYAANAEAAALRVEEADARATALLAASAGERFLTDHDAYGYFADHYGLILAGSIRDSEAAPPGAAHLADLRKMVLAGAITCILTDVAANPAPALILAENTPVPVVSIDPTGSRIAPGPGLYAALIERLALDLGGCGAR